MTSPTPRTTADIPFELRPSPIQGLGAFATRRIRKGARIIEYIGERITQDEADRRYDDESMERHHTFLFNLDARTVLDAGKVFNESRYINHSCEPNCQSLIDKKRIYVFALRTLEPGEELTYDYAYERSEDMGPDAEALYVCRCGAATCRGTILAPPAKAPARKKKPATRAKSKARGKDSGVKAKAGGQDTRAKKTQAKRPSSAGRKSSKKSAGRGRRVSG
ncbi:SET domain-containing protein-lysine N-methyltransferase [Corallococcus sp. M34]|uniref:SET domain-containing protein n=1 Tax=Citreicoccus inhibens TaxID=2849499 RepID=UPI001C2336E5|nr:SET domain-containing protein-lysine N-methyltransferase [Citreicoccus inhibens]MBU8895057.1 SET domain-containing protein-lysine N-methyltransferase [Citreicoccus inhibens]